VFDRLRTANPLVVDALIAVVLAIGLQVQLVLRDEPPVSVAGVVGGLALTLPLAWRRRAPLPVLLTFVAVGIAEELLGGGVYAGHPPPLATILAGCVAFYTVGASELDRPAAIALGVGIAGLWTTVLASGEVEWQSFAFSAGLVALSPWLAGRAARARAQRFAALAREREERARTAASEERQRIARELHDVVAHGVVLMVLQAQGARRILDTDPQRARDALAAIEETGQTALTEIRRSVGLLRGDGVDAAPSLRPQPTLEDLDELVAEMRAAGLRIDVTVRGRERRPDEAVGRSAYRILQEALTNAIRHAGPVPTHVTLTYGPEELQLEVADDGAGPTGDPEGGHGLEGMRERARLHGGELHAHARNGRGFVVRARLPL
jgi:signal transduction histidine kinase